MPFTLCLQGYDSTAYDDGAVTAKLTTGLASFFAATNTNLSGMAVDYARASSGCDAPASGRRRAALAAALPTVSVSLRAFGTSASAVSAVGAVLRTLTLPSSSAATSLLVALQTAGLTAMTSLWTAPVVSADPSLTVVAAAAAAAAGQPAPPSPPPQPPHPPLASAPPGARGGAGGARNREIKVTGADGAGAAIGYAIAACAVLWLPAHMLFHAITAAHVRRTAVTFAVALQCRASLPHGASDVHKSLAERAVHRMSQSSAAPGSPRSPAHGDDDAEGAEEFVLRGRRFAAPGLAEVATAYFAHEAGARTVMRPLLRSPLLAALGGAGHKGQEASALAARRKPKGAWKRFKRALHAELAWHKRAWHHAARGIKRCFTPRLTAEARAAGHGAGHVFRMVPAADWLGESAPPTAALFEVCVEFGWRGRHPAATFRAALRDAIKLSALEDSLAATIAAAEAAEADANKGGGHELPPLGIRHAGIAIVALLDDEPFARLDAKLSRKVAAHTDSAPDATQLGLSPPVAERLGIMLQLCMKRKDAAAARRSSWFRRGGGGGGSAPSTPEAAARTRADGLASQGGASVQVPSVPEAPILQHVSSEGDVAAEVWEVAHPAGHAELAAADVPAVHEHTSDDVTEQHHVVDEGTHASAVVDEHSASESADEPPPAAEQHAAAGEADLGVDDAAAAPPPPPPPPAVVPAHAMAPAAPELAPAAPEEDS